MYIIYIYIIYIIHILYVCLYIKQLQFIEGYMNLEIYILAVIKILIKFQSSTPKATKLVIYPFSFKFSLKN